MVAGLVELAVDAPVAPRRVLVGETEHEASEVGRRWRPTDGRGLGLGPVAGDESPVPAKHGGGLDDEEHLSKPAAVDGVGEHRQDAAVGVGEPRPLHLALQDHHLVPEGEDLGVATVTGHHEQPDTGDQETEEVGERTEHDGHRTEQPQGQDQGVRVLGTLRVTHQPTLNRWCLVGRLVVEHDMDVEVLWHGTVDQVQEALELLGSVPSCHVRDHMT